MKPEHKKLHRYSDQYYCSHCNKQWDVNDPHPPACKTGTDWLREMRDKLKTKLNKVD